MEYEHGLGKKRSKFGYFIDQNSISQQVLADKSGVSKSTISRLCHPAGYEPSMKNAVKLIKALKDAGFQVEFEDFWSV